ncbi:MAG TPA: hypothetical protein VG276_30965 [Actinomycetes bacterium]|nr:hypothetical protein [Actinomycetes bacterium]
MAISLDAPARPSVSVFKIWVGGATNYLGPDEVLHCRCKRGHPWSIPVEDLWRACRAANWAGRRDVVAGVDVG